MTNTTLLVIDTIGIIIIALSLSWHFFRDHSDT